MDDLTPVVTVHLITAALALVLGGMVLWRPKGTATHKATGRFWVALMVIAAVSSFWIRDIGPDGGFSWIHLLSVLTLFSLAMAIRHIRNGRIASHRGFMMGSYIGLAGAGAGALAPGRVAHDLVFGLF